MKIAHRKYLGLVGCGLAIGLTFIWLRAQTIPAKREWVTISRFAFGSRTNGDLIIPTVSFWVSNTGPRSEVFYVNWFECRNKRDKAYLAHPSTNSLFDVKMSLSPGSSTNLVVDIGPTTTPEDRVACCSIWWIDESPLMKLFHDSINGCSSLFRLRWQAPFNAFTEHGAWGASTNIPDYFCLFHGLTRSNVNFPQPREPHPGTKEWDEFQAWLVFRIYCNTWPEDNPVPERVAAPIAAPPPR